MVWLKRLLVVFGLLCALTVSPASAQSVALTGPSTGTLNAKISLWVSWGASNIGSTPVKLVDVVNGVASDVATGKSIDGIGGSFNFIIIPTSAGTHNYQLFTDNGAASVSLSNFIAVSVAQLANVIDFPAPADAPLNAPSYSLSATASSGLPVSFVSNSPPVCTVSGASVTLVKTGTCSVTASQAGNAVFAAATPVLHTFIVTQVTNVISFVQPADVALTSGPVALTATASSGLPVTLLSNFSSVCTVSGGQVTVLKLGTCSITASQPGNINIAAALPVTVSFAIKLGTNIVTFPVPSDVPLKTATVTLAATASSGLPVAYVSTSLGVCSVSGAVVTLIKVGTCAITATQAGDVTYLAAPPVAVSFGILLNPNVIAFTQPADAALDGGPVALVAAATSGEVVSFVSDSAGVCTVSGSSVTFLAAGPCSVTASAPGNASFAAALPVTRLFNVTPGTNTITFPVIADIALSAGPVSLTATASSALMVAYVSNSPAVCTVLGASVALVATGTCSITASQAGNTSFVAAKPVMQSFKVLTNVNVISFAQPADAVMGGPGVALTATASSALVVVFSSSTPAVCTVSGASVTLVSAGVCTITASQPGNVNFAAALNVARSFTVKPALAAPVAANFTVVVPYGISKLIDLAPHVTGTFTSLALGSPPSHGRGSLSGTRVTYVPGPYFSGADSFTYIAVGPGGSSAAATVSINVLAQPDPTTDSNVVAEVKAEVSTMERFGQTQLENVNRRLEMLHEDDVPQASLGVSMSNGEVPPESGKTVSAFAEEANAMKLVASEGLRAIETAAPAAPASSAKEIAPAFYVWSGGTMSFGTTSVLGAADNHFTSSGVTTGIDTKLMDGLKGGFAVGFGRDRTKIGVDGSSSNATYYSASLYATYKLLPKTFLDVTLGYGSASFDNRRYVLATQNYIDGRRQGNQIFGSATLTREQTIGALKLAFYSRLSAIENMLNRSTETGSDPFALAFARLNQTSYNAVLGARAIYPIAFDWGTLSPQLRLEYRHSFDQAYVQNLTYASQIGGPVYAMRTAGQSRDELLGALGFQMFTHFGLSASAEYQISVSAGKIQAQTLRALLAYRF